MSRSVRGDAERGQRVAPRGLRFVCDVRMRSDLDGLKLADFDLAIGVRSADIVVIAELVERLHSCFSGHR